MKVKVLYFASLRDAIGSGSEIVEVPEGAATLAGVRETLVARGDPWAHAFRNLKRVRGAVNQEVADDEAAVAEGDEIAFFPPVTGG